MWPWQWVAEGMVTGDGYVSCFGHSPDIEILRKGEEQASLGEGGAGTELGESSSWHGGLAESICPFRGFTQCWGESSLFTHHW